MALTPDQVREVAAQCMEHLCTHEWHGYTQAGGTPGRWGDGEGYCIVNVFGTDYKLEQGDRDCSAAVISVYKAIGIETNATYTGDMKKNFVDTGLFKWYSSGSGYKPVRGDICLREGQHAAMHLGNGKIGEFSIAEDGGIYGKTGDQIGKESSVHNYYNFPWNGFLHYTGGSTATVPEESAGNAQTGTISADLPMPKYRGWTKEDGWLDWMIGLKCTDGCGDDYAGIQGHMLRNLQIENLGPSGWYQLNMRYQGELGKNQQNKDTEDYITGVAIYYDTPNPTKTGYYKAKYRVASLGGNYYKWEYDEEDGGAGDYKTGIDRMQLTLCKAS